ncbi:MAG: hypothetical protein JWQ66_4685 [Mucilaginibacter sp.]|nr:hypothetical protein [Mucilaginibacter sp.]
MAQNIFPLLEHELKKLRAIADSLNPAKERNELSPDFYENLRQQLEAESGRVTEALTKAIFTPAKDDLIERYIQYHQTGIIQLADQLQTCLAAYAQTGENTNGPEQLLNFFISCLFNLLHYIERFFSKYFDLDARIPEAYRLMAVREMSGAISGLLVSMEEKIKDPDLVACLSDYLLSFNEPQSLPNLNFRSLIYLKGLVNELEQVFQQKEVRHWDLKLSMTLIYLNFNHLGFLVFCQDSIRRELEDADSADQSRRILTRSLSLVKSLQTKPGFSYHPAWPNIKNMLENWLSDEVAIAMVSRHKDENDLAPKTLPDEKLPLHLSVAHIACLTRLFYEEGCFGNVSVTDLLKFTARHYRSKRQQQISTGSLSKEYYGINQVPAAVVRDLLQKMIARINKHYFPVWAGGCAVYLSWSLT